MAESADAEMGEEGTTEISKPESPLSKSMAGMEKVDALASAEEDGDKPPIPAPKDQDLSMEVRYTVQHRLCDKIL